MRLCACFIACPVRVGGGVCLSVALLCQSVNQSFALAACFALRELVLVELEARRIALPF